MHPIYTCLRDLVILGNIKERLQSLIQAYIILILTLYMEYHSLQTSNLIIFANMLEALHLINACPFL